MEKQRKKVDKSYTTESQVMAGALIGIGVISLIQLLSVGVGQLDLPLKISLYCFSISIPFLSAYWLNSREASHHEYYVDAWYDTLAVVLGSIGSITGICGLFWHFSWVMGVTFLAVILLGLISYVKYSDELEKANKPR